MELGRFLRCEQPRVIRISREGCFNSHLTSLRGLGTIASNFAYGLEMAHFVAIATGQFQGEAFFPLVVFETAKVTIFFSLVVRLGTLLRRCIPLVTRTWTRTRFLFPVVLFALLVIACGFLDINAWFHTFGKLAMQSYEILHEIPQIYLLSIPQIYIDW